MGRTIKARIFKKLELAMKTRKEGEILIAQDVTKEGVKQYRLFESYDELKEEMKEREESGKQNHFYEIIEFPCYMYIDVDMIDEIENIDEGIEEVRNFFKGEVANVYASSKTSYHFRYPSKIKNMEEGKEKCREMIEKLEHPIKNSIDINVYGNRRLFRLMGSTKKGKDKVKRSLKGSDKFEESLINFCK